MKELSYPNRLKLLKVWSKHFKIHSPKMSEADKKAFNERFMAMGKEFKLDVRGLLNVKTKS